MVDNNFCETPAIGIIMHNHIFKKKEVSYNSNYGKTLEVYEPSEGSSVISKWFGGEHPSQTKSKKIISQKEDHMINTFLSIYRDTPNPIIIKNAWNCFRIEELSRLLPNSKFIWIRRDIEKSATSDLEARKRRGSEKIWNSATTFNYREIQKREPFEQVVLQQYEYNKAIGSNLSNFAKDKFIEVWYEDLCESTNFEVAKIKNFLDLEMRNNANLEIKKPEKIKKNEKIIKFIDNNRLKFKDYMRG